MGMLADRFGRRPIILLSLTAYILAFSGYLFAASAWLFILLRGLAGVFTAGLIPAIISVVGDLAPEHRRAQWVGIVNGGASAGWILGPIFGGLLYDRFGYVVPFSISIAMELGALFLALSLLPETHTPSAYPRSPRPGWTHGFRVLATLPAFYLIILIGFVVVFAWAFIEPQFMFYTYDDLAWTSSQLGFAMSTFGVACMFGEIALGTLSDRIGRKPVLVLGLALFSAQFLGLGITRDATWLVSSFILAGLGNGLFDPALNSLIFDITPSEHTAGMIGFKSTAGSIGNMLGPALVVLFTPFLSPQIVFLISAALVIVLTLVSGLVLRSPEIVRVSPQFSSAAVER
jgi:MFS family permease